MDKKILYLIKQEYEKKQKKIFDDYMSKKEDLYIAVPEIEEIDNKIKKLGIKLNRMILEHSSDDKKLVLFQIEDLKKEKKSLLVKNNYAPDFLEKVYQCAICKDTGYIEKKDSTVKCSCYDQLLIFHLHKQSNLNMTGIENFSSFDPNLFSPDTIPKSRSHISPRGNILKIKDICLDFIDNFDCSTTDNLNNLFFTGATGVGKTFMCNCIASELLNKGRTVLYQSSPALFNTINEHKFRSNKDSGYNSNIYNHIFSVELLIIDDLGTELNTASKYSDLLSILNARNNSSSGKITKTIISSNLSPKDLSSYYDERTVSRIFGNFNISKFVGQDIRLFKRKNGIPNKVT